MGISDFESGILFSTQRIGGLHFGVYSLGLPPSDLDVYLVLCVLWVYTQGVYFLGLPIWDLELYLVVLEKRYRMPFKPSLLRESI